MALAEFGFRSSAVAGSQIVGWTVYAAIAAMTARLVWIARRPGTQPDIRFAIYLVAIACCTLASYSLTCSLTTELGPLVRNVNLAVLLPIGCFAAFMVRERSQLLKTAAVAIFVIWGTANAIDNVRVIREAYAHPLPNPHRELTEFLISHRIKYGRADYWDAYVVDFLSRERG